MGYDKKKVMWYISIWLYYNIEITGFVKGIKRYRVYFFIIKKNKYN